MTTPQQHNLQELVSQLANESKLSLTDEMKELIVSGLHHVFLPDPLRPKAAEAFQLAFEAIGGLPRLLMWADAHPAAFYKLFARQTIPTITPVLPPPLHAAQEEWPAWLTARRLAYQESAQIATDIKGAGADSDAL